MTTDELFRFREFIEDCVITVDGTRMIVSSWYNFFDGILNISAGNIYSLSISDRVSYEEAKQQFLTNFNVYEDDLITEL